MPEEKIIIQSMLTNEEELNKVFNHLPHTFHLNALGANYITANLDFQDIDCLLNILSSRLKEIDAKREISILCLSLFKHNNKLLKQIEDEYKQKLASNEWSCLKDLNLSGANDELKLTTKPEPAYKVATTERLIHKLKATAYMISVINKLDTSSNKHNYLLKYLNYYLKLFKQIFKHFENKLQSEQITDLINDFYNNVIRCLNYDGYCNILAVDDCKDILLQDEPTSTKISIFFLLSDDLKSALIFLKNIDIERKMELISIATGILLERQQNRLLLAANNLATLCESALYFLEQSFKQLDLIEETEDEKISRQGESEEPEESEELEEPEESEELEESKESEEFINNEEMQKALHKYYVTLRKTQTEKAQNKNTSLSTSDLSWEVRQNGSKTILFNDAICLGKCPLNNKEYFGVIDHQKKLISNDQNAFKVALTAGFVYSKYKQSGVKVLKCNDETGEIKAEIKVNSQDKRIVNGCGHAYTNSAGNLLLFFDKTLNHEQITDYCNKPINKKFA